MSSDPGLPLGTHPRHLNPHNRPHYCLIIPLALNLVNLEPTPSHVLRTALYLDSNRAKSYDLGRQTGLPDL